MSPTRLHGVSALALGFAGLFAWQALARYASFHHRTFDLAEYTRIAWGLARGDFWDPIVDVSFWDGHLAFVLAPLGVVGRAVGATVPVLLVAQALCMALTALPLARIGARRLGRHGGWIAATSYLLYPNLGHVASYELHPGNLALLPLGFALDALDRRATRALCASCLAIVLCRADFALLTLMLGVTALVLPQPSAASTAGPERRALPGTAALIALGSLLYFAFAQWLRSRGAQESASAALHFGVWGGSPIGVLSALLQDPARVLAHFSTTERLLYLPKVLAPLALLPLLQPRWLLPALPFVAINLLSAFPTTTWLDSHYLTPAVPVLVVAGVQAASGALRLSSAAPAALAGAALGASLLAGGLPWSIDRVDSDFAPAPDHDATVRLLAGIPPRASVQAPDRLLPHLAQRTRVYRAPPPERGTDYVVLDLGHRTRFAGREDLLRTVEEPLLRAWLTRADHGPIARSADLLLLRRGLSPRTGLAAPYLLGTSTPTLAHGAPGLRLCACLALASARSVAGKLELTLTARGPCPNDLALRLGSTPRPQRVELLFDGLISPAQLRTGDHLRSWHTLPAAELAAIERAGLHVGALRSSGAPPERTDPLSVRVMLGR